MVMVNVWLLLNAKIKTREYFQKFLEVAEKDVLVMAFKTHKSTYQVATMKKSRGKYWNIYSNLKSQSTKNLNGVYQLI